MMIREYKPSMGRRQYAIANNCLGAPTECHHAGLAVYQAWELLGARIQGLAFWASYPDWDQAEDGFPLIENGLYPTLKGWLYKKRHGRPIATPLYKPICLFHKLIGHAKQIGEAILLPANTFAEPSPPGPFNWEECYANGALG